MREKTYFRWRKGYGGLQVDQGTAARSKCFCAHALRQCPPLAAEGRGFNDSDTETSAPVALVNQAFVKQYFPAEDPIGKKSRISVAQLLGSDASSDEVFTIVGVFGDTINRGPALPPMPHITTLFRQTPDLNVGFQNFAGAYEERKGANDARRSNQESSAPGEQQQKASLYVFANKTANVS